MSLPSSVSWLASSVDTAVMPVVERGELVEQRLGRALLVVERLAQGAELGRAAC